MKKVEIGYKRKKRYVPTAETLNKRFHIIQLEDHTSHTYEVKLQNKIIQIQNSTETDLPQFLSEINII